MLKLLQISEKTKEMTLQNQIMSVLSNADAEASWMKPFVTSVGKIFLEARISFFSPFSYLWNSPFYPKSCMFVLYF